MVKYLMVLQLSWNLCNWTTFFLSAFIPFIAQQSIDRCLWFSCKKAVQAVLWYFIASFDERDLGT